MKSAREVAHELDRYHGIGCVSALLPDVVFTHTRECDDRTAAIESRDREHADLIAIVRSERDDAQLARANADCEVERLRAELAEAKETARLRLDEINVHLDKSAELHASLATVTAQYKEARDAENAATSALDAARSERDEQEREKEACLEDSIAFHERAVKAEAALAASVRREDVLSAFRLWCDRKGMRGLSSQINEHGGSWLRDLATMDGRPAEVAQGPSPAFGPELVARARAEIDADARTGKAHSWTTSAWVVLCELERLEAKLGQEPAARPANEETDNDGTR